MRWLRPPRDDGSADASVDETADLLRAAVHEAPPSPRAEEMRDRVLARVAEERRPVPGLVPVAIVAAVLLVTLAIGVGAPAVGTFFESVRESATPIPSVSEESQGPRSSPSATDDLDAPMHPRPTPSSPATPVPGIPGESPGPGATAPATPRPVATPTPTPSDVPVPTPIFRPSGPPSPLPTPPSPSIPPPTIPAP
jgi:hypothetical protein